MTSKSFLSLLASPDVNVCWMQKSLAQLAGALHAAMYSTLVDFCWCVIPAFGKVYYAAISIAHGSGC